MWLADLVLCVRCFLCVKFASMEFLIRSTRVRCMIEHETNGAVSVVVELKTLRATK